MLKEYTFHVPVKGTIVTKVVARNAEEAMNVFFERQEDIMYHPAGVLIPEIENMIIYDNKIKKEVN